ncbi:MAG TPA: alpha/beta hydrolase-fold protein [Bacilli bacterium]
MDEALIYKRKMAKEQINSALLGEVRECKIFLPPGYDEKSRYPVIYCQDGDDFFSMGRIATHATRLILEERIEPVIIVGISVDKKVRTAEYSPYGARFVAYTRFFAEELVPYIESRYAVDAVANRRILAGDSLGGTVSLHIALDAPHLFRRIISLSGAFLPKTQGKIAAFHDLSHLHMYMLIGADETAVKTETGVYDFLGYNRLTHKLLVERGAEVAYREKAGGHTWGLWQSELPEGLLLFLHRTNGRSAL